MNYFIPLIFLSTMTQIYVIVVSTHKGITEGEDVYYVCMCTVQYYILHTCNRNVIIYAWFTINCDRI